MVKFWAFDPTTGIYTALSNLVVMRTDEDMNNVRVMGALHEDYPILRNHKCDPLMQDYNKQNEIAGKFITVITEAREKDLDQQFAALCPEVSEFPRPGMDPSKAAAWQS